MLICPEVIQSGQVAGSKKTPLEIDLRLGQKTRRCSGEENPIFFGQVNRSGFHPCQRWGDIHHRDQQLSQIIQ